MTVLTRKQDTMSASSKKPKSTGLINLADTAKHIGARLRQIRKAQRITLVQLSKTTGVDIATVSRIETGKMTGTLECHVRLASALGVKITDLYGGIEEARETEGTAYQAPAAHSDVYVHEAGKSSMAILTTDVLKKKLMPVLITIEAGGATNKEEARVGTERFLYMLEGSVEVLVGDRHFSLKKASTLYFDASVTHFIRNTGRSTARILSVVTPPAL